MHMRCLGIRVSPYAIYGNFRLSQIDIFIACDNMNLVTEAFKQKTQASN